MKVAVILTNRIDGLGVLTAMHCVYKQTHTDTRLVLINDSNAGTAWTAITSELDEIDNHYHTNVFNIEPVSQVGAGAGNNFALQHAWEESDVFVFIDSNALLHPKYIERLITPIARDPKHVGLVYCDEKHGDRILYREPFSLDRLAASNIVGSRFVVSKAALEKVGRFDESLLFADDYDLIWRVAEQFTIIHHPHPLLRSVGPAKVVSPADIEYYNRLVRQKAEARYVKTAT